jgi:hypothetical protein
MGTRDYFASSYIISFRPRRRRLVSTVPPEPVPTVSPSFPLRLPLQPEGVSVSTLLVSTAPNHPTILSQSAPSSAARTSDVARQRSSSPPSSMSQPWSAYKQATGSSLLEPSVVEAGVDTSYRLGRRPSTGSFTEFGIGPGRLDTLHAEESLSMVTSSDALLDTRCNVLPTLALTAVDTSVIQEPNTLRGDEAVRDTIRSSQRDIDIPGPDCAICLDGIKAGYHAKAILACRHQFHLSCIS